jgi:hypothetical protein
MTKPPTGRLEYLRGEIRAERISQGELIELQSLAEHIDPGDVELLEWAGVPEGHDPRAGLTPLHRLLLDLGHLSQRYSEIATADPEQIESLQEDVGSIFAAFGECAEAIEKIARQYLAPDGSVLPGPVVLVEVAGGIAEIDTYNYPVDTIHVDWDDAEVDGEYVETAKEQIRESALPDLVKSGLFERLNSF